MPAMIAIIVILVLIKILFLDLEMHFYIKKGKTYGIVTFITTWVIVLEVILSTYAVVVIFTNSDVWE